MANQNQLTYRHPARRDWSGEITSLPGKNSMSGNGHGNEKHMQISTGDNGNHMQSGTGNTQKRAPSDTGIGGMERETGYGQNNDNGIWTNMSTMPDTANQTAAEWMRTLPAVTETQSNQAISDRTSANQRTSDNWQTSDNRQMSASQQASGNRQMSNRGQTSSNQQASGNWPMSNGGQMSDNWADNIGEEIENNLPDDMIEAPTTLEEVYRGSIKSLLLRNLGNYVVATFLIGTQGTVSWEGVLYDVGNDYVAIYQSGRDQYIVCDLYSLKYVEFYDTQRRALCDAVLAEREENQLQNG